MEWLLVLFIISRKKLANDRRKHRNRSESTKIPNRCPPILAEGSKKNVSFRHVVQPQDRGVSFSLHTRRTLLNVRERVLGYWVVAAPRFVSFFTLDIKIAPKKCPRRYSRARRRSNFHPPSPVFLSTPVYFISLSFLSFQFVAAPRGTRFRFAVAVASNFQRDPALVLSVRLLHETLGIQVHRIK